MFGIIDIIDILIVATLLFYIYRSLRQSGTMNIFIGILLFLLAWIIMYKILDMKLIGTIMDKFIDIGLLVFVILFQEQIKRFLVDLGSRKQLKIFRSMFSRKKTDDKITKDWVWPVVQACMNMSKSKTGALIVIKRDIPLDNYVNSGDIINARINSRLIESIFFKNSPFHDGALIMSNYFLLSAGCILPVSHDTSLSRALGLRHRSALGIAQATDAIAIVVSEETGNISMAYDGKLHTKLSVTDIEHRINSLT